MVEAEYHGEFSGIGPCVPEAVFHGSAGHFPNSDDLRIGSESHVMEFFQVFMDVWSICVKSSSVSFVIILKTVFADQIDHVKAESFDSFSHPEEDYLLDFFSYIFVVPVEIRLCYIEQMQVVFIKLFYIFPCAFRRIYFPSWSVVPRFLSLF